MKKVLSILMILALLAGCTATGSADAKKFKEEYEAINGTKNDNGVNYSDIEIAADNPVVFASGEQIIKTLTEGSGIILFGFPTCPWCRQAIPVLLEMCQQNKVETLLYYNNRDQRDTKTLNADGTITTSQNGTDEYYQILAALGDQASVYAGLNDDSIKRLYFPTVVFVSAGTITGIHEATLDSVTDPYTPLTEAQKQELLAIYNQLYQQYMEAGKGCKLGDHGC